LALMEGCIAGRACHNLFHRSQQHVARVLSLGQVLRNRMFELIGGQLAGDQRAREHPHDTQAPEPVVKWHCVRYDLQEYWPRHAAIEGVHDREHRTAPHEVDIFQCNRVQKCLYERKFVQKREDVLSSRRCRYLRFLRGRERLLACHRSHHSASPVSYPEFSYEILGPCSIPTSAGS
jgi:hypothetical protein